MTGFFSWLASFFKLLGGFLLYVAGQRAERSKIEAEQHKEAAVKQTKYAEIASDNRTDSDTIKRMQDGTF